MSFNFANEEMQDTLEDNFKAANEWLRSVFGKDVGKDHYKFLVRMRTKNIVDTDRGCDRIQKRLDMFEESSFE